MGEGQPTARIVPVAWSWHDACDFCPRGAPRGRLTRRNRLAGRWQGRAEPPTRHGCVNLTPTDTQLARHRPVARVLALLWLALAILPAASRAQSASLAELLAAQGIQPITPPTPAPDFTLPLLAGGEGDLSASHGDWVVLTFFATWCGPCRSEMPTLERLHRSHADAGLAVLAVSVDRRRDPVEPFVAEHGLTLPVFWDRTGEVGEAYRATSIPVSYVIDPSGQIVGMARGARDWAATAPLFDALRQALPDSSDAPFRYARLDALELPEVLEPPTAEWSLPAEPPRPGRPFSIEIRLSWSGRLDDYLPQPPQIPLPPGIRRGRVAATSSSLDQRHLVRYQIELTAAEPGVYELDPIELRYLPALGDGPVAERVAGPTLEVVAAGVAARPPAALAALAAALALAGYWLYRRRRGRAAVQAPEPALARAAARRARPRQGPPAGGRRRRRLRAAGRRRARAREPRRAARPGAPAGVGALWRQPARRRRARGHRAPPRAGARQAAARSRRRAAPPAAAAAESRRPLNPYPQGDLRMSPIPEELTAQIEALSGRLQRLRDEVGKVIVGQSYMVERLLIGLLADGHVLLEGVPGLAKTTRRQDPGAGHRHRASRASSSRPTCCRPTCIGTADLQPAETATSRSRRGRSSPTSSWPTRSTAPRPRCRARCSRRCRSGRSRSATRPTRCPTRSWSWRPRTRSSRRAPTRCPRPRSTASCSSSRSATRTSRRSRRSCAAWPQRHRPSHRAGGHPGRDPRAARRRRRDLHRREGQGLHRRPRPRHARPGGATGSSGWRT